MDGMRQRRTARQVGFVTIPNQVYKINLVQLVLLLSFCIFNEDVSTLPFRRLSDINLEVALVAVVFYSDVLMSIEHISQSLTQSPFFGL